MTTASSPASARSQPATGKTSALWTGLAALCLLLPGPRAHATEQPATFVPTGLIPMPSWNAYERCTAIGLMDGRAFLVRGYVKTYLYSPTSGSWAFAEHPTHPRSSATITELANGRVLFAGGSSPVAQEPPVAPAELYDPQNDSWTDTGALLSPRYNHTASLLQNGQVLVAGGQVQYGEPELWNSELYDPAAGTWSLTSNTMATARAFHTATSLPDGRVVVIGGMNTGVDGVSVPVKFIEIYDPGTKKWSPGGALLSARYLHTATLLPSGKILVAAGYNGANLSNAELYDPTTKTSVLTGSLPQPRRLACATLLPDGTVLVTGGLDNAGNSLATALLYDPAAGTWSPTANTMLNARGPHAATLLGQKVLVAGGVASIGFDGTPTELYAKPVAAPTPPPDPTPTPAAKAAPPAVKIFGKKKRVTGKANWRVKGLALGVVAKVDVKLRKKIRVASGTTRWRTKVRLRPGKNRIFATAVGPGGVSNQANVTIRRKK